MKKLGSLLLALTIMSSCGQDTKELNAAELEELKQKKVLQDK